MNEIESRVPMEKNSSSDKSGGSSLQEYQGLNGLIKQDSLIYLNPIIQCLSNIPPLRDFYVSGSYKKHLYFRSNDKESLSKIFARVLRSIWSVEPKIVSTNRLKKACYTRTWDFKQIDSDNPFQFATNFLVWLFEDLKTDGNEEKVDHDQELSYHQVRRSFQTTASIKWAAYINENSNKISRLFHFLCCSVSSCLICNHSQTDYAFMNAFFLDIPLLDDVNRELMAQKLISERRTYLTIDNCLEETMKTKLVNNQNKCVQCSNGDSLVKFKYFYNLPKVLIIGLNRNDARNHCFIDTPIRFPRMMDLSSYLSSDNNKKSALYELISAVNFNLDLSLNRHYYTVARNSQTGKWYLFDDERINELVNHSFNTENSMVLIYQRLDKSKLNRTRKVVKDDSTTSQGTKIMLHQFQQNVILEQLREKGITCGSNGNSKAEKIDRTKPNVVPGGNKLSNSSNMFCFGEFIIHIVLVALILILLFFKFWF